MEPFHDGPRITKTTGDILGGKHDRERLWADTFLQGG